MPPAMRLFTLEEARAALPEVIPILERLRQASLELRAIAAARAAAARGATADGHDLASPFAPAESDPAGPLRAAIRSAMEALEARGIELKDPARGLIDFPHRRGDRIVYLCYELGEPTITSWHDIDAGYAGRQPL
ncbi:MAG: hypothetical protein KatS3mg063_2166 [Tepidiforma sp.]|jgi:hypothetical protein|uniref:DUF2203 family protein n=1 Tax=Tepidiforma bonchosmolovskayae TaxID=2601677 RepID=A0ABX6BZ66_9CHLR|nr:MULTISPECIES: DUF2203 domain-containing protein [Tepidiforma]QFG02277.1 DUF2203 family protein [Tepidiforma bonchosmolovskayae]GIW16313.1 MAG: hypothetical protein KatS3mg063_2166 [Tepidiforma sp.]